jgi:hypothetical protein
MDKKESDKSIKRLVEWEEHQFNPGYWINRFPLGFPTKRSWGALFLSIIDVILCIPTFFLFLYESLISPNTINIVACILFGLFSLVAILRAFRLRPEKVDVKKYDRKR